MVVRLISTGVAGQQNTETRRNRSNQIAAFLVDNLDHPEAEWAAKLLVKLTRNKNVTRGDIKKLTRLLGEKDGK